MTMNYQTHESQKVPRHVLCPGLLGCLILISSLIVSSDLLGQEKSKPTFEMGQAQVVAGFKDRSQWIQHELWVETEFDSDSDGKLDRVHVDVTRQAQTESEGLKVPVIYVSSPYFSGVSSSDKKYFWDPRHELGAKPPRHENPPPIRTRIGKPLMSNSHVRTWVPRGFAVVHSAAPGTGLSEGCPTVGGPSEALAPKAVVDWLCGRAKGFTSVDGKIEVKANWCTGKVGMTGTSYNGTIPLACATTGVDGLECIIPIAPNTSYYHYYRSNGLIRHPGGWMGEDIDVLFNFIHSGGTAAERARCEKEFRDKVIAKNIDRIKGDSNNFWKIRNLRSRLQKVKAATLMAHAFNDWNVMPEHSVEVYEALKKQGVPVQSYFHQRGHGGEPPLKMMNRWFTRYLFGIKNSVEDDARAWIVREGQRLPTPYKDYPNPDASLVQFHLGKGGNHSGSLGLSLKSKQGVEELIDDVAFSGAKLAQAKKSKNRLIYATPVLKTPVHLSGTSRIKIRLSSSKPAANLSVWVVSLPWTKGKRRSPITDNLITRGWADPQNQKSNSESAPLKPGQFVELSFNLQPDDQIIPAGQQIGLMIFSSDRDFTLWPKAGTRLKIDLDATTIAMPIVGGASAFKKAIGD